MPTSHFSVSLDLPFTYRSKSPQNEIYIQVIGPLAQLFPNLISVLCFLAIKCSKQREKKQRTKNRKRHKKYPHRRDVKNRWKPHLNSTQLCLVNRKRNKNWLHFKAFFCMIWWIDFDALYSRKVIVSPLSESDPRFLDNSVHFSFGQSTNQVK